MVATATTQAVIAGKPLGLGIAQASAVMGLDAHAITVEVCCTRGPSFYQIVGLAQASVREARVRVSSALARLGVLLDEHAVTINLAPADLKKTGAALDLAIALSALAALDQLPCAALEGILVLGELALDGSLRPVRGVLPQLEGARARGLRHAIVPARNAREAGLVSGITAFGAAHLEDVVAHLRGQRGLPPVAATRLHAGCAEQRFGDLSDVRGQSAARRALEIAAAGGHNLLLIGPPGGGKTLLARLLPTILPPLSFDEALETTKVHSVAGLVDPDEGGVSVRPFRAPHHSVSEAGLVGGGEVPRPGEVSLAHHGVLFLDELAEFRRGALEALRQPLEDGQVCIARARARAWFPARPLVVAAVNPCPCGYFGHPRRPCRCSDEARRRYLSRLSGPLLDRIDLHVGVPPVDTLALCSTANGEPSASVRARVEAARACAVSRRAAGEVSAGVNATLSRAELDSVAAPDSEGRRLLDAAISRLGLSARAYVRVLRVARTIADLADSARVRGPHIAEAISGRLLDREVTS